LRDGTVFARFVVVFVCVVAVAQSTTREAARASHRIISPALGDVTVNQGLTALRTVGLATQAVAFTTSRAVEL
jgi:hypothetical protein